MSRSKIPRYTTINGVKWRVISKRNVYYPETEELCHGVCHYDKHVLEVSVASDDDYTIMANFYHELAHAWIHESGIDIDDSAEHAPIKTIEKHLAANVDWRVTKRKPKKKKID